MARVTMIFELFVIVLYIQKSSATSSVAMPYCKTKQRCDEIWEAPNISDCIKESCLCTRGSEYVESLQTCQCRDGYVVGSTGCLPAASQLGSSCEESIQCTTLGEPVTCDAGKCSCLRDALIIGGTCHKKKYPNQNCTFEEECAHISKLVCLGDRCVCEEGHFLSPDERSCLSRLSSLSDRCQDDIQCSESFGKGSHCRRTCVCKDGFREVNNEKCVLYMKENEECSSTTDCYSDLKCVEGKCFRETEVTTRKPADPEPRRSLSSLSDRCQDDIQCSESFGKGSHCRGTCVCKDGFREVNNEKCVLYMKENEECSSTTDCYSDLKCVEGKCFRETEVTTRKPADPEPRRNVGSLGWTPPSFLTLSVLLLSLNVLTCGSRM